ncbi:hypothetical protein GC207_08735 [bacterium]|nr:hypothetical protein [bacterium]
MATKYSSIDSRKSSGAADALTERDIFELPDWSAAARRRTRKAAALREEVVAEYRIRIRRQPGRQERRLARKVDREFVL